MISRTKYELDEKIIRQIFEKAQIGVVSDIAPLGAGEYNAVYCAKQGNKEFVLKIAPIDAAPTLKYETNMMEQEIYWYKLMRENTNIRVPEVYFFDYSKTIIPTNYFIMEKLTGKQLNHIELSKEEKEEARLHTAVMAEQLHRIKNDKFGYVQTGLYDNWYLAIREMSNDILKDCYKKGKKTKKGVKLIEYIDKYKSILENVEGSMVNFDIWDPNILCEKIDGKNEFSWIDPERSFWGDKMADFVCFDLMTSLEKKDDYIKAYNKVAINPINNTYEEKIRCAIMQGYLALLMATEKYYRYTPHHFGWWRNVITSNMLYKISFKVLDS